MRKRVWGYLVLVVCASLFLTGCGNDPDKNFQKGKYAEAYPEFIKRAGTNEVALKNETANGSFDPRNKAGNQAIHDLYYAAECQKKLGNTKEAEALYRRVVDLSNYQIRIPHDQSALLKDALGKMISAARDVRSQEVSYGRALREWESQPPSGGTDPYDNGGSGTGNTDPYNGGGTSTGGNTDPYNGGSNTDPYSGGSNTDPYSNNKPSGGSNTDPYAGRIQYATTDAPSRYWLDSAVTTLRSRQREFEKLLYSTTTAQVPSIDALKKEYERSSRQLDNYLNYAAPGGMFFKPDSLLSQYAWQSYESGQDTFQRSMYGAQGVVTYETKPLVLKEPNLVTNAKSSLTEMGVAISYSSAPTSEAGTRAAGTQSTSGTAGVKVNSTSTNPFGQ
jgi:major membrane immunogen (membrane-anchored lipoprotein)